MLSVPIVAGALMRFPLGVLSQYIGRKNATLVEMGLIVSRCCSASSSCTASTACSRWACCSASPAAASASRCRSARARSRAQHKGLAMGLVGAGNVGTAFAVLLAPPLAQWLGWQAVYAVAAGAMLLPILAMIFLAKEPSDVARKPTLREHVACLFERDGWVFSLIYGVTFGGFIGLASFLPSYYHDQFGV